MPIEIKELHIKAVVSPQSTKGEERALKPGDIVKLKKEITKEVTEKILRYLQQKNER